MYAGIFLLREGLLPLPLLLPELLDFGIPNAKELEAEGDENENNENLSLIKRVSLSFLECPRVIAGGIVFASIVGLFASSSTPPSSTPLLKLLLLLLLLLVRSLFSICLLKIGFIQS